MPASDFPKSVPLWASIIVCCAGSAIAYLTACGIMIFVLGQYEPLLGSRSSNFVVTALFLVVILPMVALGGGLAWVFTPRVAKRHATRLLWSAFCGGVLAIVFSLAVVALINRFGSAQPRSWEQMIFLVLLTAGTNHGTNMLFRRAGLISSLEMHGCVNCGYDLRGRDHERCPECGHDQTTST